MGAQALCAIFCGILSSMKKSFKSPKVSEKNRAKQTPTQASKGSQEFNAIIEQDSEGYYVASVLELPGCHTQAKTLETLKKRLREAIEVYLEVEKETLEPSQFVGVFRISY